MERDWKRIALPGLLFAAIVLLVLLFFYPGQQPDAIGEDLLSDSPKPETIKPPFPDDLVTNLEEVDPETGFATDLAYREHPVSNQYCVILGAFANVREGPSTNTPILRKAYQYEKLNWIESVWITTTNGGITKQTPWLHVSWSEDGKERFGFLHPNVVQKRMFQFQIMKARLAQVDAAVTQGPLTYIRNYKDKNGRAPAWQGRNVDDAGTRRYQSAPGYLSLPGTENNAGNSSNFRYLPDGLLVRHLGMEGEFVKVSPVGDQNAPSGAGAVYYVPKAYVPGTANMTSVEKAILVDRNQQNEAVFEKRDGQWVLISKTLATTGMKGQYQQETPLGYYYGIEKRDRFYYYKDGTTSIQGYAPYAIRFSGGAYLHGVPVNYRFREGVRIDPGFAEASRTLGTIPLSHKCVRNYTSHAKFLYDWFEEDRSVVIVIE